MATPRRRVIATASRACCTPDSEACVCGPQDVLALLGRPYALVVVSLLSKHRVLRFNGLAALVEGASAKALTARLRELEEKGILVRRRVPGVPPGVEYALSPFGAELYESLAPALSRIKGD